jgi:hypothetical protein
VGEVVWAELDVMLLALALLVLEMVGVAIAPGATLAK